MLLEAPEKERTARADKPDASGVLNISHKHDAILTYLLANPTTSLKNVAREFSVSGAWLSCIVHSDVFQDKLAARQDLLFHNTLLPIKDKILSLTHLTMDRLVLAAEADALSIEETRKAAEMGLRALGMGKSGPGVSLTVNTQNNLFAPAELLARARASIGGATPCALKAPVE